MSHSSGSSSSRNAASDRFYTPPLVRKHKQKRLLLDSESAEPDSRTGSDQPALSSTAGLSNLDSLLDSLTPSVPAHSSCEPRMKGRRSGESSTGSYYVLEDLWETYREWSAYGLEVPVNQEGEEDVKLRSLHEESGVFEPSNETSSSPGQLVYEYLERAQPHIRPPLHDKVTILASEFPSLKKYRSCDISPSSWFSVAWYPIYRIPVVSSLKQVEASFITFHSLSDDSRREKQPQFHASSGRKIHRDDGSFNISLPTFGLASYKLRGSMLAPSTDSDWQKVDSLLLAASDWLQNLQVKHPDYLYFGSRC